METEAGKLVWKLVGDTEQYKKAFDDAAKQTEQDAQKMVDSIKKVEDQVKKTGEDLRKNNLLEDIFGGGGGATGGSKGPDKHQLERNVQEWRRIVENGRKADTEREEFLGAVEKRRAQERLEFQRKIDAQDKNETDYNVKFNEGVNKQSEGLQGLAKSLGLVYAAHKAYAVLLSSEAMEMEKFNHILSRSREMTGQTTEAMNYEFSQFQEDAGALKIEDRRRAQEAKLAEKKRELELAEKDAREKSYTVFESTAGLGERNLPGIFYTDSQKNRARAELASSQSDAVAATVRSQVKSLERSLDNSQLGGSDAQNAVNNFVKDMSRMEKAAGQGRAGMRLAMLENNFLLTEEQKLMAKTAYEAVEKAQKMERLKDSYEDFKKSLEAQTEAMGKNSDEVRINKMVKEGLSKVDETILRVDVMLKNIAERQHKTEEAAKATAKHYAEPVEVYNERVRELTDQLATGKLPQEAFNKAMEDAKKKYDSASFAAARYRNELGANDSTLVRSAEFQSRAIAQREFLRGERGVPKSDTVVVMKTSPDDPQTKLLYGINEKMGQIVQKPINMIPANIGG